MAERKLPRREFSSRIMNRNWDLSNDVYVDLIEKNRLMESSRYGPDRPVRHSRLFAILIGPRERSSED
jgi:hypothetical protein